MTALLLPASFHFPMPNPTAVLATRANSTLRDYQREALAALQHDLCSPSTDCKPISTIFSEPTISAARSTAELHSHAANFESRYVSFNIRPLVENCDRVEVRLHSGTTDAAKILPWLSLWQQILWIATQDHIPIPIVPDSAVIHPSGDIVALAKSLPLPGADDAFLRRLDQRRNEVASLWQRTAELQGWTRYPVAWHPAPLAV